MSGQCLKRCQINYTLSREICSAVGWRECSVHICKIIYFYYYNCIVVDEYGTGALQEQQFAVYSDLAEVLETDFTAGNRILTEVSDFYTSCIAAQLMNQTEFVDNFLPVIRKFYQNLGVLKVHVL